MDEIHHVTPHPSRDQSPTIGALAGALAKAQLAMDTAKKDARNPHLGNQYADLTSCWAACRKPLGDNGLAVTQLTESLSTGAIKIISILLHESNEWIRSELTVPCSVTKGINPAQAMGSAISYGRRYGLSALVGISTDDDDGTASSRPQGQQEPPKRQGPRNQPKPQTKAQDATGVYLATPAQIGAIQSICKKHGFDPMDYTSRTVKRHIESLENLNKQEAGQIIQALNQSNSSQQQEQPF